MVTAQEESVHLIEHLRLLQRRLWVVILIFVIVTGTTIVGTMRQTPVYEASAEIMVGRDISKTLLPGSSNPLEALFFNQESFDTQIHILESRNIAEGVVDALHLADSDKNPAAWKAWAARVRGQLRVERVSNTRVLRISAQSSKPELARDIANTAAKVYIEHRIAARADASKRTFTWLTEQIADVRKKLEETQLALIDYVEKEKVTSVPRLQPAEGQGMELSLDTSGSDIILQNLRSQHATAELKRAELLESYREEHPLVKDSSSEISRLQKRIMQEEGNLILLNKKAIQYRMLDREAQVNQEFYDVLIMKLKEVDITGSEAESDVRVIEWAGLPTVPIRPNKKKNIGFGVLFGLLLGFGSAFMFEYFDRSVQTPDEAQKILNLPVLSYLPRVKGRRGLKKSKSSRELFLLSQKRPKSHEAEMFKRLRTNVRFSFAGEDGPRSLLVTSSGPKEGKTTIVTNLGVTLAQSGFRTILIDTDLRRPRLHYVFECKKGNGMGEYLEGTATLDEIIRPTSVNNLSVIPVGVRPHNPSELLESGRIPGLIAELKKNYDYIVFDSPPAGSLADTSILASFTDGVLLVLYAGHVDRGYIMGTKEQLEKAGAKIFGVVLNNIDRSLRGYYYYYYHYYKYYGAHRREGIEG